MIVGCGWLWLVVVVTSMHQEQYLKRIQKNQKREPLLLRGTWKKLLFFVVVGAVVGGGKRERI